MKRYVKASADKEYTEHIKATLFDYIAEGNEEIDGVPADRLAERIEALYPDYTIEDILRLSYEEGIYLAEAVEQLEEDEGE